MTSLRVEVNPLILPLSVVVGVLLALCIGVAVRLETGYPPGIMPKPFAHLIGRKAPFFKLEGLDGAPVSYQRENHNSDWLLFFTDSGCGACDAAYPSLKRAMVRLPVVVIGIGKRQQLKDKLVQFNISATTAFDSLQIVKKLYQVNGFPSALLIDKEGHVRHAEMGTQSVDQILTARKEKDMGER